MNARQPTDLSSNRTDLRESAAIRTPAFVQNVVTKDVLFEVIENQLGHVALLWVILGIRLRNLLLQRVNCRVTAALLLRARIERRAQSFAVFLGDLRRHLLIQGLNCDFSFLNLEGLVEFLLPATEPVDLF